MGVKYEIFMAAKRYLRVHPGATDEQVAEAVGIKAVERDELLREVRKDLAADAAEVTGFSQ